MNTGNEKITLAPGGFDSKRVGIIIEALISFNHRTIVDGEDLELAICEIMMDLGFNPEWVSGDLLDARGNSWLTSTVETKAHAEKEFEAGRRAKTGKRQLTPADLIGTYDKHSKLAQRQLEIRQLCAALYKKECPDSSEMVADFSANNMKSATTMWDNANATRNAKAS